LKNAGSAEDYTVTCGEHQLNVEESFQVDFPVTEVVVHPNYKSAPDGYDIAIYKVRLLSFFLSLSFSFFISLNLKHTLYFTPTFVLNPS